MILDAVQLFTLNENINMYLRCLNFTAVPVDASSAAPSAAEVGRVLLAICGLVRALLHAETHCSHEKMINPADTGRHCLHEHPRAAGAEGGSRQVRRQLWSHCRLGGRSSGCQGESHWDFALIRARSFPGVSSPGPVGRVGVSLSWEMIPGSLPVAFSSLKTSETAAERRKNTQWISCYTRLDLCLFSTSGWSSVLTVYWLVWKTRKTCIISLSFSVPVLLAGERHNYCRWFLVELMWNSGVCFLLFKL